MDPERAGELLARERARIEHSLSVLQREGPLEGDENLEAGDEDTEDLYQDEYNEGLKQELVADLAAVDRAEARLAAGTYGLSVETGQPIPNERLEAQPTAERTVEEQQRWERS